MFIFQEMPVFILIFLVLLLAYSVLIDYYRRSWNSIPETNAAATGVKVSLVVALRNEEQHLEGLVGAITALDYPEDELEIILVDDHSEDGTWQRLCGLSSKFTVLKLPDGLSGKKKAIEKGIAESSGQLIITTDADCTFSPGWIRAMVGCYLQTGAKFIAAPVRMTHRKNFIGIFQSLDFLTLQGITGASVYKKFHTLCNGANLAYEKRVFEEVGGFAGIDHIPSGDDMLLMYKIFRRYPADVHYLKNKEAVVSTPAETSIWKFFQQRIRWASKAVHYDDKNVFYILLLVYIVNVGFIVLLTASAVNKFWLPFLLLFFLMKLLAEFPFLNAVAGFFGARKLMVFFPLMQPFHIVYTVIAGWMGRFGSYQWKSRTIKNKGRTNPAKL
jgi:cellulose synthase/poly-beta-1,6-N-acetylglucosamine synthase-like glycosyltransferase